MNELRRIFNKKYIAFIIAILILNGLILINSHKTNGDKMHIYNELVNLSADFKTDDNTYREAVIAAWKEYSSKNKIDNTTITEDMKEIRTLLLDKAEYVDGYATSIKDKIDMATKYIDAAVFQEGSFEELNLMKSRYDLDKVKDIEVILDNGIWLEKLYEYDYIQIFVIIILFITVYSFFLERKKGLYYLVHSGAEGRSGLFLKRTAIIVLEAIVASAIMYLESAIILLNIYGGFEDVTGVAISDEALWLTSSNFTRVQFVIVMILLSALCAVALAMGLWMLLSLFSSANVGIFVYMFICGIDILVYHLISSKMILRCLHFVNVHYLIYPMKALGYSNWGYSFGITSLCQSTVCLAVVIGVVAMLFTAYMNVKHYYMGGVNIIEKVINKILEGFMKLMNVAPMCVKEAYKVLISQRSIIILAALVICVTKINTGVGTMYNIYMGTMLGYYDRAEGLSYGEELESIYDEYEKEYEELLTTIDYEDESDEYVVSFRREILADIRSNIDYLKKQSEAGVNAVVINPYEYSDVFGKAQEESQKQMALINILATIVIAAGFMSYERKCEMTKLAFSSSERKRWIARKLATNAGLIAIFLGITYGIYYHKLAGLYKFESVNVPLKSLNMFEGYVINPSILGFILIDLFIKFVLLVAISIMGSAISYRINYIYCVLISLVLILPQLLYMLGLERLERLSIGRYIAFLPMYNAGLFELRSYYIFLATVIVLGICLLCRIVKRERA